MKLNLHNYTQTSIIEVSYSYKYDSLIKISYIKVKLNLHNYTQTSIIEVSYTYKYNSLIKISYIK